MALCIIVLVAVSPRLAVSGAPCWRAPVAAPVVDPFREPPCTWCAGNRGLEYDVARRTVVRVAATGHVEFAGHVAGVAYVVVRLPNGWRHTYGRLSSIGVAASQVVLAGTALGRSDDHLFFGLRIGERYVDPAPWLATVELRPRLVPTDGSEPRSAPEPRHRCPVTEPAEQVS